MTVRQPTNGDGGQATIETVALLPLLAIVVAAVLSVLAAGRAQEQAGSVAEAAAIAVLRGEDPERSVPGHARVRVRDGRIEVTVRPHGVLFPALLEAHASAAVPR